MSKDPRYYVQSEQVRGERRTYYVVDRASRDRAADGSPLGVPGSYTTSRARAERRCDRLNGLTTAK